MVYNVTFMETSNTIFDVFKGVNDIKPGWFSGFVLFALFLILLGAYKDRNLTNLSLVASFITSIVAVLFFSLGTIGVVQLIIPILILFASIILKVWADE